ncbi:MAG: hypothetical protein CL878_06085 [Dehalococcoidia bacterium]|nr:hypothetical protein [Dehalococcoidia bacterium]
MALIYWTEPAYKPGETVYLPSTEAEKDEQRRYLARKAAEPDRTRMGGRQPTFAEREAAGNGPG